MGRRDTPERRSLMLEYRRRSRLRNREKELERCRRYHYANKAKRNAYDVARRKSDKVKARALLRNAVQGGQVIKSIWCEDCGNHNSRLHGHHEDYSKPYEVNWLCALCHGLRHQKATEPRAE